MIIIGGRGGQSIHGSSGKDYLYGGDYDGDANSGQILATRIASGLDQPVYAGAAPGDDNALYVAEKAEGKITRIDLATGAQSTFLDIPNGDIVSDGEGGLLSFAFDPNYASNGRVFVYVANSAGDIEIRSYVRSGGDPLTADAASKTVIIQVPHPGSTNHFGGQLAFGPDGYLYASTGDGGGANDPSNNAQNKNVLLGKILRLDVNGDDFPADSNRNYAIPAGNPFVGQAGEDEIWALGLRNAWRFSFDSATGDLMIGDVGQDAREEVDVIPLGAAGLNFGWRVMEGTQQNFAGSTTGFTAPIYEYDHDVGHAITGGYVYHGPSAGLQSDYVFADFISNRIFARTETPAGWQVFDITSQIVSSTGALKAIASFGVDAHENLYAVSINGQIYRLDPSAGSDDGNDVIVAGNGNDVVFGGAGNDTLVCGFGNDYASGGVGNDRIYGNQGNDRLFGGAGDDLITGGLGRDVMTGNAGADRFIFMSIRDSGYNGGPRDIIADFRHAPGNGGDIVDLKAIDANTTAAGNQAFTFIGRGGFHHVAGELRYVLANYSGTTHDKTIVQGDVNGDGKADFQVELTGLKSLTAGDFIL